MSLTYSSHTFKGHTALSLRYGFFQKLKLGIPFDLLTLEENVRFFFKAGPFIYMFWCVNDSYWPKLRQLLSE